MPTRNLRYDGLTLSAWTVAVFGTLSLTSGIFGLWDAPTFLGSIGVEWLPPSVRHSSDITVFYLSTTSLASINMGLYYILAAVQGWRPFFYLSAFLRFTTALAFSYKLHIGESHEKLGTGAVWFEAIGGVATLVALLVEKPRLKVD